MAGIDYFFSVASPYAYLAGTRLEAVAATRGAAIRYRPMDGAAVIAAAGGKPVAERHWSRRRYRAVDLARIAAAEGMPLTLEPRYYPVSPRPMSRALIAAQSARLSVGLAAHAAMRAVWAENRDLADPETVAAILRASGVDPVALEPHLEDADRAFEANTAEAIDRGVFGAPFYFLGEEPFWGQDRLPALAAALDAAEG